MFLNSHHGGPLSLLLLCVHLLEESDDPRALQLGDSGAGPEGTSSGGAQTGRAAGEQTDKAKLNFMSQIVYSHHWTQVLFLLSVRSVAEEGDEAASEILASLK